MLFGLPVLTAPPASAVSATSKLSFISGLVSSAQAAQRAYGVPASVSIAQAAINSSWGTDTLAKNARNYFDTRCMAVLSAKGFASVANAQVGKRYILGAEAAVTNPNPSAFDCSELVQWVYGRSGNPLTDLAAAQYDVTTPVKGSPKVGDLVFLRNNPARANGIGHVAVLTAKLSNGDWRIIEARGRAYGVVRTTLSYWKKRSYYAGLRRYSKLNLVGDAGVVATTVVSSYQAGCVSITSGSTVRKYRKYTSGGNSILDHASFVASEAKYASARAAMTNVSAFASAIAAAEFGSARGPAYARGIRALIDQYDLTKYDVVPINVVLSSGNKGAKVSALQYLLRDHAGSVQVTGVYDSRTISAVKTFQRAKGLTVDGEAGPNTLLKVQLSVKLGDTGYKIYALRLLLAQAGYLVGSGSPFDSTSYASLKAFQTTNGIRPGSADADTWSRLFMALDTAPTPKISGTTTVGQTLTATAGSWGSRVETGYQWYRDGAAIAGATGYRYTLQPADALKPVTVAVTGFRPTFTPTLRKAVNTAAITPALLTSTPAPKVLGTLTVGNRLSASAGAWGPAPVTLRYQWYRSGKAITGATGSTYVLTPDDYGAWMMVAVTGSKTGYYTKARGSAATKAIAKGTITRPSVPRVSGTLSVGNTVTAVVGTWKPMPRALRYQWYRNGVAIPKATASTYKISTTDANRSLQVQVTSADAAYVTKSVKSPAAKVAAHAWTRTGTVTITGTATAGRTIRASVTAFNPSPTLYYQWYRNGKAISKATRSAYTVSRSDRGTQISVVVTARRYGYVAVFRKAVVKIR